MGHRIGRILLERLLKDAAFVVVEKAVGKAYANGDVYEGQAMC